MVGNGVTNWTYDTIPAFLEMGYWHSLYDGEIREAMKELECDYSGLGRGGPLPGAACMQLFGIFDDAVAKVNVYDIFGYCYGLPPNSTLENYVEEYLGTQESTSRRQLETEAFLGDARGEEQQVPTDGVDPRKGLTVVGGEPKTYNKFYTARDYTPWAFNNAEGHEENLEDGGPPCVWGGPVAAYFNNAKVREALHIPQKVQAWSLCKEGIDYTVGAEGSQQFWEKHKGTYRMLKFSGDIDGAVPTTGTMAWINSLGRDILEDWRPYYIDADKTELGGYVVAYDGLTLGTVHGAGHMCPQHKPPATYHLIFNWLNGKDI